jgi:hypothetical protein
MGALPQRTKSNGKSNEARKEKHMAKKHQKRENQPEQQPTAPVQPVELSDEELGQVVGGFEPNSPTAMPDLDAGANHISSYQ